MFNKNIKIVIAALFTILAIVLFTDKYIAYGIFSLIAAGMLVLLYFKNELILLSFLKLKKQDLKGTQELLDKIQDPEKALVPGQLGYYNYLYGIIFAQTNMTQSEKYLKKALKFGLNMEMDQAVAKLNLAGIAMTKRRKREAQNLIAEVKKLDKQGMLKDQIATMKKQMGRI